MQIQTELSGNSWLPPAITSRAFSCCFSCPQNSPTKGSFRICSQRQSTKRCHTIRSSAAEQRRGGKVRCDPAGATCPILTRCLPRAGVPLPLWQHFQSRTGRAEAEAAPWPILQPGGTCGGLPRVWGSFRKP